MATAVLVLVALAQTTPGVSARAPARRVVEIALSTAPTDGVCASPVSLVGWSDASDSRTLAAHPTARLDDQELAAAQLRGLVQVGLFGRALQLLVLGSPLRSGLVFTRAGWRPRWPFC